MPPCFTQRPDVTSVAANGANSMSGLSAQGCTCSPSAWAQMGSAKLTWFLLSTSQQQLKYLPQKTADDQQNSNPKGSKLPLPSVADYVLLRLFNTHLCKLIPNHLHFKTEALKPTQCSSSHLTGIPSKSFQLQHYPSSVWQLKISHLRGHRCTDTSVGGARQHCLPGLS